MRVVGHYLILSFENRIIIYFNEIVKMIYLILWFEAL